LFVLLRRLRSLLRRLRSLLLRLRSLLLRRLRSLLRRRLPTAASGSPRLVLLSGEQMLTRQDDAKLVIDDLHEALL
jgi:hypothetical protein